MFFSKSCTHGIKAAIFLAQNSLENPLQRVGNVAKAIDAPEAYTAKILQQLVHATIVKSKKGAHGGFYIETKRLTNISLKQVVEAIDGPGIFTECSLRLHSCNTSEPCPIHFELEPIRNALTQFCKNTTLDTLAASVSDGKSVLNQLNLS